MQLGLNNHSPWLLNYFFSSYISFFKSRIKTVAIGFSNSVVGLKLVIKSRKARSRPTSRGEQGMFEY